MRYDEIMATLRNVITFRCKKCKVSGSAEISETDHPYSTETYVNDVTPGFLVSGAAYPDTAKVRCEECGKKVR
ncbi:hypothetical protein SPHINGO8AM_170088 [Sphingomonas sp. 8AM]|nr:hypothetical protein SPHINGO8AM_170088 [Sphingomonas sp. 8AM]